MEAPQIITEKKEEILKKWVEELRAKIPGIEKYDRSTIEDDVPHLLDALAIAIETGDRTQLIERSESHGNERAGMEDFSLIHIIREYRYLKNIIFEVLDKEVLLNPSDRNAVMYMIDQVVERAGERFFQEEKQKMLKEKHDAEESLEKLRVEEGLRDDYVSFISHDLQNPLASIKVVVQLLEVKDLDAENRELLKIIKSSTEKAEKLIRDLLDVNRVNSGEKIPLNTGNCDLVDSLKQMISNNQLRYEGQVELKTDHEFLKVNADCNSLMRATENLVDNALKYGDAQKPVTIKCRKKKGSITLSVHNHGEPIPLEKQASIFSKYYRVEQTTKGGWGIGLSLVKGIAEAHGGIATVKSAEGHGTRFSIVIPDGEE